MFVLLRLLLAALCLLVRATSTGFDVSLDGTVAPESSSGAAEVTLNNRFASTTLSVFWDGGGPGKEVFIGTVAPGESLGVNSFVGHRLLAKPARRRGNTQEDIVVEVARASQAHDFGPDGEDMEYVEAEGVPDVPPNPRVKIIGHRTTAMNARFRCLTPYAVDYYYDDGGDGVFSGTLSLGKETSVRTAMPGSAPGQTQPGRTTH